MGERRKHHGLQVGFATILTTYLQGQIKFYDKLLEIYGYMGFPRTLKNIGIGEEAFLKALLLARGIRNRYTILNKYNATKLMESINILK
ncbi:MAG: hypothetical protein DRP00_03765 [Candidatus Aenigmatarchaeota archaeon]|nr:MAG: hypothetical protein DRP00_03765 [Candidatus Aenigmarchaeota archaeon]